MYWKSQISILDMSDYVPYIFPRERWLNVLQTVKTPIRRRILIWVCTGCRLPFWVRVGWGGVRLKLVKKRFVTY